MVLRTCLPGRRTPCPENLDPGNRLSGLGEEPGHPSIEIADDSRLSESSNLGSTWKATQNKQVHGCDVELPSVHNSYTKISKYLKLKGGSPAWARTTIRTSDAEYVSYRVFMV